MPQGQPAVPVVGECEGCGSRVNIGGAPAGKKSRCAKCGGEIRPISVVGSFAPPKEISSIDVGDLELGEPGERSAPPRNSGLANLVADSAKGKSVVKPPAGAQKLGKITLVKELGRGGMGIVYLGRDEELRRTVALKVLLAPGDDKLRQRFLREARLVSKLRHPNIVAVHEFGEQDGKAFFTMDFIEGGALDGRFKPPGMPVRDLMQVVAHVARALDYAHGQGMVHRDVKPQNILVTPAGVPYLTDFGLAREVESNTRLTVSGAVMGTPSYMSPEQAMGAQVDSRTDLYSLGAVIFEGLTGRPPFDGMDLISLLGAIVNTDPVPPSSLNPNVPADVETICLKALQKQKDRRYQTGAAMADDIERWLRGEAITARRSGAIEHGVNWLKRRPAVAIGGGAALVALLVIAMIVKNSSANERMLTEQRETERKAAAQRTREIEEQTERDRVAFEGKIRDLEARLSKAATPEDAAKIARELAALKGGPGGSDWDGIATRVSGLVASGDFAGAIAALEGSSPADAEKKAAKLKEVREAAAKRFDAGSKDAAALESAGKLAEAADAWRALERIGIAELAKKAADARGRIEAGMASAQPAGLPPGVQWVRMAVAARLRARDFDGAKSVLDGASGAVPETERTELEWARAGTQRFHEAVRAAFTDPKGMKIAVWTSETPVTVTGCSEKGVRAAKDSGALTLVEFADIRAEELARVASEAKAPPESIALFWCFWDSPRMGKTAAEREEARARNRKTAKASGIARVAALLDALQAAEAEAGPAEDFLRAYNVETTGSGASQKWTYDFSAPEQLRDWVAAAAKLEDGTSGWGARVENGRLRVVNATVGFPVMLETPASVVVQFASAAPADRSIQVYLNGYCCEVRGGTDVVLRAPDGREMRAARISPLQAGQPFMVDLRLLDRNFAAVVNGHPAITADRGNEFGGGPTGVGSARDGVLEIDQVELTGRPDAGAAERWLAYRAYLGAVDARPGTTPPVDGSTAELLAKWERPADGSWQPFPRGLRGTAKAPSEARADGNRNFRFSFEYCVNAGRAARFRARSTGDAGLDWLLPTDRMGEWRRADALAIEGFVFLRVDGVLTLKPAASPAVAEGRFALGVIDGDVSFRNFRRQAFSPGALGDEPPPPWIEGRAGAAPPRPPVPEGWTELFDGRTLTNFIKKERVSAVPEEGVIVVDGSELLTSKTWKSVEVEIDFEMQQAGQVSAGLRGSWFGKDEVGPGRHRLWMKNTGDKVEAHIDGRPLGGQKWNPTTSGCAKMRVESTQAKVVSVRWRPVAEPEIVPERPPDKPGPEKPPPDKPPKPGPGPGPGPGPKGPPPGPGPGPKPK